MTATDASICPIQSPDSPQYQTYPPDLEQPDCNVIPESSSRSEPTVGQFSFAPTTRTTIVTTTTTTTTNFPPLVMQAPKLPQSLDPKHYPLAGGPTPESLRNVKFTLDGKSIVFHEPDDAVGALIEKALRESNGTLRSVTTTLNPPSHSGSNASRAPRLHHRSVNDLQKKQRSISPSSSAESSQRPNFDHLFSRHPRRAYRNSVQYPSHLPDVGLATPETENASFGLASERAQPERVSQLGLSVEQCQYEDSPTNMENCRRDLSIDVERSPLLERRGGLTSDFSIPSLSSRADGSMQPRRSRPLVSRLVSMDQNSAENIPLPSPRLSPVAAVSSLHQELLFDSTEDQATDTDSSSDHGPAEPNLAVDVRSRRASYSQRVAENTDGVKRSPSLSLMDIPLMLNYFESIPDELKSYVMYQLLRRCPKPTLQLVADVVNPALKCDFLAQLPFELSLNVVKFLDVQSMCRASQVSKKWRHIINSDEKTWKAHFDYAGFVLPEGELQTAIEEGWGWQYAVDCEKDLRLASGPDTARSLRSSHTRESGLHSKFAPSLAVPRKPKRKAISDSPSRKLLKKQLQKGGSSERPEVVNWSRDLKIAEGPYVAASAAALAVPYPDVGLPSLRSLHLYKSLYQRHHLIRKTWMNADTKPLHIAFQAHDRHVVTCLQFDTDKILTGSDDTNIHVYDTKTGALRATLEGHEGGVWALEYHGNTLVSGSTDRSVRVWDIEAAECTQIFQGHISTVRCLQILLPTEVGRLPDGSPEMMPKEPLIITGSRDFSLRVWRLPQPGDPKYYQAGPEDSNCPYFIRAMNGHNHSVRAIAAHGDTLVSGSYDCTVRVWRISTGEAVHRLEGHSFKVYSVVLDHKRNRCISGSMDHLVKIWSLETGSLLYNLEGHTSLVGLLDLQADKLVSAAADSTLRIWDPETGRCKSTLIAHTGAITCFEHDSQKVISGSDRTLKMWNIKTGECIKDLLTDLSGVWQVRFNDRRCVAAVQRDRLTYIEILDFGASRDRIPANRLGRRIVVDKYGGEIQEDSEVAGDEDGTDE
ncbi:SCF ubiquitin ligase complex subunit cdc4 [Emydomyces testavorans]|uniref:Probable E3 ubiquitin ligase complex SCF subunit sconB n=1 Tax=Emydomyces testavorans TaxID=2070801 RepID=A0AAF0INB1_9EURO|nr:SCF ubiquitin ligase complex subunit cdc4 [Emydomyces testavorans]